MVPTRLSSPAKRPSTVIAVGASAGGLESVGRLLADIPESFPAPILVVLHLDPHHHSQAVPLLQRRTKLRVQTARAGVVAQAGAVYVAPPDHHLQLRAGKLRLTQAARVNYSRPSIDVLFTSVAADCGPAAVAVVLSGTGSDGSAGVVAVKARGGLAVAEDASTAAFPFMPAAAGRTGLLDAMLPIGQIPTFLLRGIAARVTISDLQWHRMLALLNSRTGAKFSLYRSTTLYRRLQQRLAATGCRTMAAYLQLLASDVAEVERLQAAFLIKVSSFFRDPASWRILARDLALLTAQEGREVRAWSAGCATGEEAYTLAFILAQVFGIGPRARWKVFGTDLDHGALKLARAARYSDDKVRAVPKDDLARYFVRDGRSWRISKALRARVVFGRHDLLHDRPLSGMDVLVCRNILIYFKPEEKTRTLERLCLALNPGGILFLGRSEAPGPLPGCDRLGRTTLFRRRSIAPMMSARRPATAKVARPRRRAAELAGPLADSSLTVAVAIDAKDKVLLWNRAAQTFFGKAPGKALGKPLATAVGLETARQLKATMRNQAPGKAAPVECKAFDGPRILNVECLPGDWPMAALFLGTEMRPTATELHPSPRRGAVQSVRGRPHTADARLVAQQDLNDELQSRNEELETVNEELQSLNDAMSAMEEEMRGLGEESRRANDFLRLLLDTSSDVLIACDADNRVAFWNDAAIKAYRLSAQQAVGRELFDLVPALAHAALEAASQKVRTAGRGSRVKVTQGRAQFVFDPLPQGAGKRRGYLLRVPQASL